MTSFSDDFARADSSNLGAGWVEVSGDWSIVSGQLSPGAAGGTIILRAAGAMASSDHYAQVKIAATVAASQGVWCRGNANISSGYLWRNDGASWDLFSVVDGSFTVIGSYAAAAAPGDVAKVQAVGSTITAYVNGVQRVSVVNTHVTSGTSVGIRSESAGALRFDDFVAADVTAGATLGVAGATETAQQLTGAKTATQVAAGVTESAQPLTGAKSAALPAAAEAEAAQALPGTKTGALGQGSESETAQQPTGSKTGPLGTATESSDAQAATGTKTTALPTSGEADTAIPPGVAVTRTLGTAASGEDARPLTGSKTATLAPAAERDTARPLTAAGPEVDIEITVGAPAGAPYGVGVPHGSGWEVGAPC